MNKAEEIELETDETTFFMRKSGTGLPSLYCTGFCRPIPYTERVMTKDMMAVMNRLGYPRFSMAGHDWGGRVAYRLALGHPGHIIKLAVLDVVPTATVWDRADQLVSKWPFRYLV